MFGEGDSLEIGGDRLDANPIRLERLTLWVRNRSHLERVTQLMRIPFACQRWGFYERIPFPVQGILLKRIAFS